MNLKGTLPSNPIHNVRHETPTSRTVRRILRFVSRHGSPNRPQRNQPRHGTQRGSICRVARPRQPELGRPRFGCRQVVVLGGQLDGHGSRRGRPPRPIFGQRRVPAFGGRRMAKHRGRRGAHRPTGVGVRVERVSRLHGHCGCGAVRQHVGHQPANGGHCRCGQPRCHRHGLRRRGRGEFRLGRVVAGARRRHSLRPGIRDASFEPRILQRVGVRRGALVVERQRHHILHRFGPSNRGVHTRVRCGVCGHKFGRLGIWHRRGGGSVFGHRHRHGRAWRRQLRRGGGVAQRHPGRLSGHLGGRGHVASGRVCEPV